MRPTHHGQLRLPLRPPLADGPSSAARAFTRQALAQWNLLVSSLCRPHLAEDALLVVGELVANACRHGGHGPAELILDIGPGVLRITISDHNPEPPQRRVPVPGEPGGYGLRILDQLTTCWDASPQAGGKAVWAQLDTGCGRGC
ncbi:ATP-binding protein [Kitasatospora sp. NPDC101235]|uniref:ATP-binding protein n=1 Tax=Kitasatospora sp. NPDC101235 TaxID=3364101 RepID=UPI0037FA6EBD